jgi:ABC-type Fe3+-hydroxamate transport system substrate-binding protein
MTRMSPPDAAGSRHLSAPDARIVSLVPSLTELLFDLGLQRQVVGRTAFCVHPEDRVRRVRSVGGTKTVDMAKLAALAPSHVVVNIDETPRPLAEALAAAGMTLVVTHPIAVRDNLDLYRLLGSIFDREAEAGALCERFEAAYAGALEARQEQVVRDVLYLIWKDPWMTVSRDTYIARMLELVGLRTLPANADRRYPTIGLDEDLLMESDFVLFSSEPFPFREDHLAAFRERFPRHASKAQMIDAQMVSWYGSRAIPGLAYLARFVRTLS